MKEQLVPGVWVEDGVLHVDTKMVAKQLGIPFTEQTQAMIVEEAKVVFKEYNPNVEFEEVKHDNP